MEGRSLWENGVPNPRLVPVYLPYTSTTGGHWQSDGTVGFYRNGKYPATHQFGCHEFTTLQLVKIEGMLRNNDIDGMIIIGEIDNNYAHSVGRSSEKGEIISTEVGVYIHQVEELSFFHQCFMMANGKHLAVFFVEAS